jgi:PelA/Pel-15E family pectate lyase
MWGDIVVSWQFTTGAFPKSGFDHEYQMGIATEQQRADTQAGRRDLGTFDNGSTITELASLGYTYKTFKDPKHQAAAQKTLDWVLSAQGSTGGWPQWYPARTGDAAYSAHATFNDEAMIRVPRRAPRPVPAVPVRAPALLPATPSSRFPRTRSV